jgi:hypothetical protein
MKPKGQGKIIHVSGFICPCHGRLRLSGNQVIENRAKSPDQQIPDDGDSFTFMEPSKDKGYWTNSDLINQITSKVIPIFNKMHEDCQALFFFDNSKNHHAMPPDALSVSRLNMSDGGSSFKCDADLLRNGYYFSSASPSTTPDPAASSPSTVANEIVNPRPTQGTRFSRRAAAQAATTSMRLSLARIDSLTQDEDQIQRAIAASVLAAGVQTIPSPPASSIEPETSVLPTPPTPPTETAGNDSPATIEPPPAIISPISTITPLVTEYESVVVTPGCRQSLLPPGATKVEHSLRFHQGDRLTQKGVRRILEERGLWDRENPPKLAAAKELLSSQPDFKEQMEWVAETVTKEGHLLIYLPKFHCELNCIEHLWCSAKAFARKNCTYSFPALKLIVPQALESVTLETYRRQHQRCERHMHAYIMRSESDTGLSFEQAQFAVKKYSSHRRIPQSIFQNLPQSE